MSRIKNWIRLGIEYLFASGLGQILGLLSGLLYVRYMSVEQYALYGLCLTALTFTHLASDLGLTGSINYFWRKSRQNSIAFSAYFKEVLILRKLLFIGVVIIAICALYFTGRQKNFSNFELLLSSLLLAITAWFTIQTTLHIQILRLLSRYNRVYFAELSGQFIRFIFAVCLTVGLASSAVFGLLGGACGVILTLFFIMRSFKPGDMQFDAPDPDNPRQELSKYILPIMPSILILSFQDTIIFMMAAYMGSKLVMAEVFALGRIMVFFGVINMFLVSVMIPRLSGISDNKKFNRASIYIRLLFLLIGLCLIAICWRFPDFVLLLLGEKYAHLQNPLLIVSCTGTLMLLNNSTSLINRTRGWVRLDMVMALIQFSALLLILYFFDFSQTYNVMLAMMILTLVSFLTYSVINTIGFMKPQLVSISPSKEADKV